MLYIYIIIIIYKHFEHLILPIKSKSTIGTSPSSSFNSANGWTTILNGKPLAIAWDRVVGTRYNVDRINRGLHTPLSIAVNGRVDSGGNTRSEVWNSIFSVTKDGLGIDFGSTLWLDDFYD